MGGSRVVDLLYQGACATCGLLLAKGEPAYWDADTRVVYCLSHNPMRGIEIAPSVDGRGVWDRSPQRDPASPVTQREEVGESPPRIGGLLLAVTDGPQTTKAWSAGGPGERSVGECLDALANQGVIALHDSNIPGSSGHIDEIAVAPSGVFVIEVKRYEGRPVKKDFPGSIFRSRPPSFLFGGSDRAKLVSKMAWQMDVVRRALEEMPGAYLVPGRAMLTFVGAQWGLFRSAFDVDGIWVGWPKEMAKVVSRPGPLGNEMIQRIAELLSCKLKASDDSA